MVIKNQDVRLITEYLFLDEKQREVKYKAVKKEVAVVSEGKNVELVEELLDLQDLIKRELGKIKHLELQIEEHKGLTDLQYYQSYLSGCVADNYINEQEKKGLYIQRKNRNITDEQHLQVLSNLCITMEEYENMLLPCCHLAICEGCSVGEGGKSITCPICHKE